MKKLLWAALAVVVPVTALQAMTVATFLDKADALQRRGALALFSSDLALLKSEVNGASLALRNERLAVARAGRRPAYCPPAQVRLNSDELLASFRAIPPAQRTHLEVRDALRGFYARKFPCPG